MASAFDFEKALRRIEPERYTSHVPTRPHEALFFVDDVELAGPPLLLDTCVYIHVLKGKTPRSVDALLTTRTIHHSATVIGELTNRFGSRLPTTEPQKAARREWAAMLADIPVHRTVCPTIAMWGEAGIVAGIRSRTGGFTHGREQDGLNDVLILLQSISIGANLVTSNTTDFDVLEQIIPSTQVTY